MRKTTTPDDPFEPYAGPRPDDGFEQECSKPSDLKAFIRSAEALARKTATPAVETLTLQGGSTAQILQTSGDAWELVIHLGRDFYKVFSGRSRDEVLRMAGNADGINH
jgi:hypothetical protein